MLRRGSSIGGGSDFKSYSKDDKVGSRLEEKKKRLKEQESTPSIKSELTTLEREKVRQSVSMDLDEDETPTGFLDEGDVEDGYSEEETPTGFLDEEDDSHYSMPKLKVERKNREEIKVAPKETHMQNRARVSRNSEDEGVRSNNTKGQEHPQIRREKVYENPPVKAEDSNGNDGNEREVIKPKSHTGLMVLVVLLTVVILGAGGVVISKILPLTTSNNDNEIYTSIRSNIDSFYTDALKNDINSEVSVSDISACVEEIEDVKDTNTSVGAEYENLLKELSSISFFIQDRVMYNDLKEGIYIPGSEDYSSTLNTIKSDIDLYTVPGLSQTMQSRVAILEMESGSKTNISNVDNMGSTGETETDLVNDISNVEKETAYLPDSGVADDTVETEFSTEAQDESESEKVETNGVSVDDILNMIENN